MCPKSIWLPLLMSFSLLLLIPMTEQANAPPPHSVAKRQFFRLGLGDCLFGVLPPLGASIQYSQGTQTGPFLEGTVATVLCHQGIPLGQSSSVCLNGGWTPALLPACSVNNNGLGLGWGGTTTGGQCLTGIAGVPNGNLVYSLGNQLAGPYPHGTVVTLHCLNAQLPNGPGSSTCLNGMWQPPLLGQCNFSGLGARDNGQQQCAVGIGTPLNGRIVYSNGATFGPFPSGTSATLFCNAGFQLRGQHSAICQNGVFNPSIVGSCE